MAFRFENSNLKAICGKIKPGKESNYSKTGEFKIKKAPLRVPLSTFNGFLLADVVITA
jgi:hypothetical protein